MKEILENNEALETKLQKLDNWINTVDSIENLYLKTGFGEVYIPFAITALEAIKPDKNALNYNRNLVLRILYRLKIYESGNLNKLSDLVIDTINHDNIHNVSLAFKCLAVLFKKSKFEPERIQSIADAFSTLLEDIMQAFRLANEKLISQVLHVFSESLPFLGMLVRAYPNSVDRFDKITRELYTFAVLFMSKNEFNIIINNNETIMIQLINSIFRIVKYFMDLYMTTGKDFSTKSAIPEMCMFIVNFCPNDAETLKKEIYQQITHYCINCRDLFFNFIDIFLSDNILIKPVPKRLRFLGVYFATEIAVHYKDKINKDNLIKIIKATCQTITSEFSLCESLVTENRKIQDSFEISKENYSILFSLLNTLLKINEIFSMQKYSYYEKHAYYMKIFYEVLKVFCVLTNYVTSYKQNQSSEVKTLLKICIRIIKNTMHYFGTIKENVPNLIHSLKCFSQDEISKFAKLMHFSIRLFSHEMFSEEDKPVIDEMYVIFVYLEEPNFLAIVTTNTNFLLQCTKKNSSLFLVWKFYLGIKSVLTLFYAPLIDELLSVPFDTENELFFTQAYEVVFKALQIFPKEADSILAQRIEIILQNLMDETDTYFYKYQILFSFFSLIDNCEISYPAIYRTLSTKVDGIVKALAKHHKTHPHKKIITEVLLIIPKKFLFIISQLKLFVGPLLLGLDDDNLKMHALNLLHLCIDNLQSEFLDENTDGKMREIFYQVLQLTKDDRYADCALGIIYKYKGDKKLGEYKVPHDKSLTSQDVLICNESFTLNVEPLLYRCFDILRGKHIHQTKNNMTLQNPHIYDFNRTIFDMAGSEEHRDFLRNAAFKVVSSYIHKTIGWSHFKDDCVVQKTTRFIKEMIESGFYVNDSFDILTGIDKTNYLHIMRLTNLSLNDLLHLKKNIYDAVLSIFHSTQYSCAKEAFKLLESLYFTVLLYKVIERFKLENVAAKIHFDYLSFIEPLLECFSNDTLRVVSEGLLRMIYDRLFELCGSKIIIAKVNLYNELLSKLIVYAYYTDYYKRKSSLNGILFIIRSIDCGVEFVHSFRCHIFKALYFMLRDPSQREIQQVKEILNLLILKTYNLANHDFNGENITEPSKEEMADETNKTSGFECSNPDIVYQLLLGLHNFSTSARKISQSMLEYLAELRGLDVTELILPYRRIIINEIKHWSLDQKKQSSRFNYFLEKLSYILMLRPPLVNVHDDLLTLVNLILSKHERLMETNLTDKHVKSMPIYFTFAYTALTVVEDKEMVKKLLLMFSTGLFSKTEIAVISSKALKYSFYKYADLTKEILYAQYKPTFSAFFHDKIDIQILQSVIQILEVINNLNKSEMVERLTDLFKQREELILVKSLEIASLLPGYFPDHFLCEVVEVSYFLEQRNKLLSNQRVKNILKEICEKNLVILKIFAKRLNDFCIFKIMRSLVRTSPVIKGFIKDNPFMEENLFAILLCKEAGVVFQPAFCFSAIRVYQDLRQRNKDASVIRDLLRSLTLSHDNINMLYEIDDEFFFCDPKERFIIGGLSFFSRKKLMENYIKVKENSLTRKREDEENDKNEKASDSKINDNKKDERMKDSKRNEQMNDNKRNEQMKDSKQNEQMNDIKKTEQVNDSKRTEIKEVRELSQLVEEDLKFYGILESLLDSNIDMDSRGKIFYIFYLDRIHSKKVVYHCGSALKRNFLIKYRAILYLSTVDPKECLLEPTLHAHSEFKMYTEKSLENLTRHFAPEKYTDQLLSSMRNQTNYKNNLFVLYPLFISKPSLISHSLVNDLFDAICRLFATMVPIHQKLAINLLESIYQKYEYLVCDRNATDFEKDILKGLSICYTIFFSNVCHLKDESMVSKLQKYKVCLNLNFLFFVEENINMSNFSKAIIIELEKGSNHPECREYTHKKLKEDKKEEDNIDEKHEKKEIGEAEKEEFDCLNKNKRNGIDTLNNNKMDEIDALNNKIKECDNSVNKNLDNLDKHEIDKYGDKEENGLNAKQEFGNLNKYKIKEFDNLNIKEKKETGSLHNAKNEENDSIKKCETKDGHILSNDCPGENKGVYYDVKEKETYASKIGTSVNKYIRRCFCDNYIHKSFVKYVDTAFLMHYISKFIEVPDNFKTAKVVFERIIDIRKEKKNLGITDQTLFDMFVRVINILSMSHGEYTVQVLQAFIALSPELNTNINLTKSIEVLMTSKLFTHKSEVARLSVFLLHDKDVSLADKITLLNSYSFTRDDNLSYILPFFKERSDIAPILKKPFLAGLRLRDKSLRDEFYDVFSASISTNTFTRLKYLLSFEWQLYGEEWIYVFFRMCLLIHQDLKLVSTKFYVFGDDSYYENIYERIRVSVNLNNKPYKIEQDVEAFLEKYLTNELDELAVYDIQNIIDHMYDILSENYDIVLELFPSMLFDLIKRMTREETLEITDAIVKFTSQEEIKGDLKVFYKVLYLLVVYYDTDQKTDFNLQMQDILNGEGGRKAFSDIANQIKQRVTQCNYVELAEKTGAHFQILELIEDKHKKYIYEAIHDETMCLGAAIQEAKHPETVDLLVMEQRRDYEAALVVNEKLQNMVVKNELVMDNDEYEILENEWKKCAKKLQQWDILYDVGNNMGDPILSSDACFRNASFASDQERQAMGSIVSLRPPSLEKRFYECFLDFMGLNERPDAYTGRDQLGTHDNKHSLKERLKKLKKSYIERMLQSTLAIPSMSQKLTYVRCIDEMIKMPMTYDFIPFTDTLVCWDLFANFRLHLYDYIIKFDTSKKFYHEKAKILSAFCSKLRNENCLQATLYNLQRIFTLPSIEATDAYDKIINEVKILTKLGYYDNALDIINTCNINFFDTPRKANIYAWKCIVYEKKGELEEAQKNIMYSVQIDGSIGNNWYTWGIFLNKKFDKIKTEIKELQQKIETNTQEEKGYETELLIQQRRSLYEEHECIVNNAFSAFLQATIMTAGSISRRSFLRLLKYLEYENEIIKTTFLAQKDDLDVSKYFFFISQLLDLLCSETYFCAQVILNKMLEKHPQSIFIPARIALDKVTKKNKQLGIPNGQCEVSSRLRNLIQPLNFSTANTFLYFDKLIKSLVEKFEPTIEDNCYKICYIIHTESIGILFNDSEYSYETLLSMIERLLTVVEKSQVKLVITTELKKDFENYKRANLFELAKIAHKWKIVFGNIIQSLPLLVNLCEVCNVHEYSYMPSDEIHVFGQYNEIKSVYDDFITIEHFEPTYATGWRNSSSLKILNIRGSDGKVHPFIFIDLIGIKLKGESQVLQFAHFLNSELEYDLRLESFIDLTDNYRLVLIDDVYVFLDEVIEQHERLRGRKPMSFVFRFIELLQAKNTDSFVISNDRKVRYDAFVSMMSEFGDDVLCSYFRDRFKDADSYHLFRNNLMKNYAVQNFLFYIISAKKRTPSKTAYGQKTGSLFQLSVYPSTKEIECVNLRFTPNIQKYYGYTGLDGVFTKYGYDLSKALVESDYFKDIIYMFFRGNVPELDDFYASTIKRIDNVLSDVNAVVKESTDPYNLCMENPLWQAWF